MYSAQSRNLALFCKTNLDLGMRRSHIKRFSLNVKAEEVFIENEFLTREFGFDIHPIVEKRQLISHGNVCFIATANPLLWHEILSTIDCEVVLILLGNESYDTRILELLDSQQQIKHLFIYNGPRENHLVALLTHIHELLQYPKLFLTFNFWKFWVWAFRISQRTRRFVFSKPFSIFPLGYTDRFVNENRVLGTFNLEGNSSILDQAISFDNESKPNKISFFGQEGNWYRQHLIQLFRDRFSLDSQTYKGFGGNSTKHSQVTSNYTESLLLSRFTLCAPGEVTNETFRYLESLIMGCIPVIPRITIQDHHFGRYISDFCPHNLRTYSSLFKHLIKTSNDRLKEIHALEIKRRIEQRDNIRSQLVSLVG
jgi:hypothetical protein